MKNQIRDLVSQNKLSEAIKLMLSLTKKEKTKNSLTLIQSRLNEVNEKNRLGILSEDNSALQLNQIRNNLMEILGDLDKSSEQTNTETKSKRNLIIGLLGFGLVFLVAVFFLIPSKKEEPVCTARRVAILVADFQDKDKKTDSFANSVSTRISVALDHEIYDVTPIGPQSRQVKKYDDFIRTNHFESSCDTSGIFVNGYLNMEEKVFNVYITIANLIMKASELTNENSINLDNPNGIEFSISNDAKFLADFVIGIVKSYEGKPLEALDIFFELEKNDVNGILSNDKNFKANFAYFKGNCYAMRGDNKRAIQQYDIVQENGNSELRKSSNYNKVIANEINIKYREDPELRTKLNQRIAEHSKFEKDVQKVIKTVGNKVGNFIRKIK